MKNKTLILLGVIVLIASFLRFYKLGEVPFGFYQDESAIGYNAYSLLKTGKDEHGKTFPLYFKSFGDHKLPVYIYATTIPVSLFGMTEYAVRFPSAFFGVLTVAAFFFLVREMSGSARLALMSAGLLAINPWHLHYTRATFEVSLCLFLFVLGTYLLLLSFRKKIPGIFLLGTICFIVSLYGYNLTRLLAPVLYVLVLWCYRKDFRHLSRAEVLATIGISVLLLVPFAATLLQGGGAASAKGTFLFTSKAVQAPHLEFRSYVTDASPLLAKLFFNSYVMAFWQYLQNIFLYFSVPFFFITGSGHGNHGIGNVGYFYLFELPLIILGVVALIKRKKNYGYFLLFWYVLVVAVASLTRDVPHATRSFFLLLPLIVFSAAGAEAVFEVLKKQKGVQLYAATFVIFAVVLYNLVYYFSSYYLRFPVAYAAAWRSADKDVALYIKENEGKYAKIIFDKKAGFVYSSLLFYLQYPPDDFLATVNRDPDDAEGFSPVTKFGKYEFRDIDWNIDMNTAEKILIVTTHEQKPNEVPPLQAFYYPIKPVVFSVNESLVQYPIEDIAYVLVETK